MALPIDLESTWVNPDTVQLDADELRRADSTIFTRSGIVRATDTALGVYVSGADVVTIQPGPVVIPCNAPGGAGYYRFALPAAVTGALAARNATNPRIDLVVARQMDTDVVAAHGAYTGRIEVLPGAPSATPSVPALPDLAVELARITIPAAGGGAATVDSTFRTYAVTAGGILYVPTSARLPAAASRPKWEQAIALDTGVQYSNTGAAWTSSEGWAGTEAALAGASPPAGAKIIRKTWSHQAVMSGGSGIMTIPLPAGAFPNGLVTALATVGSSSLAAFCRFLGSGYALGSVQVQVYQSSGTFVPNGTNVRVNLIAYGW